MRTAARRLVSLGVLGFLLASATAMAGEKGKQDPHEQKAKLLTRSIYVPLELRLCQHLRDAVLYQEDQAVGALPAKRIFQFTYYPELSRIEPVRTDLRVEGVRSDGSEFVGRFAVTPWGVFTANHKIQLDMDEQLQKMRFKLDVRYPAVLLRMKCDDACGRTNTVTVTDTASDGALQQED